MIKKKESKSVLTVIVCTCNRSSLLQDCLDSLLAGQKSEGDYEILVVDNNSSDDTSKIVEQYTKSANIRYVFESKSGLSHARNRGIKESVSDYVAFVDDDAVVAPDWAAKALVIINKDKPAIFGGPIFPYYKTDKPEWFQDEYEARTFGVSKKKLKTGEGLCGSNIFFKRKIFENIGYFNSGLGMHGRQLRIGEETELQVIADKRGLNRYYYPELIVYHFVPASKMRLSYILKRRMAVGRAARAVYGKRDFGFMVDFYYLAREIFKFFLQMVILLPRNRKIYPYWQNYFINCFTPICSRIGRLASYLPRK